MRLATLDNGAPDGSLIVVSSDGKRFLDDDDTLLAAISGWDAAIARLGELSARLAAGEGEPLPEDRLRAPLPRTWQWLDGSVYPTHAELMQVAFGLDPIDSDRPLMYQGMSDRFLGPRESVALPSEDDGIDFEGEFGVILDRVPMGTSAEAALDHVKLLVQINDWSLRAVAPIEMKTGFGWIQAKPACSMAPFAITPDELGEQWRGGRICLDLHVAWNGKQVGCANGEPMLFHFGELIAHAARTRELVAGTVIGSGTVSNPNYAQVGSSCISEVRAIEMIADGKPHTGFMKFGDRVQMTAVMQDGSAPFGSIEQEVVQA